MSGAKLHSSVCRNNVAGCLASRIKIYVRCQRLTFVISSVGPPEQGSYLSSFGLMFPSFPLFHSLVSWPREEFPIARRGKYPPCVLARKRLTCSMREGLLPLIPRAINGLTGEDGFTSRCGGVALPAATGIRHCGPAQMRCGVESS